MVDPVLLVGLALAAGAPLSLAPLPTALAFILTAALLRARAGRLVIAAAGIALGVAGFRAHSALSAARDAHARASALLAPPRRCFGMARVIGSPVPTRAPDAAEHGGRDPPSAERRARIDVVFEQGTCGDDAPAAGLRARIHGVPEDLSRGDLVEVIADLSPVHLFSGEGLPSILAGVARSGIAASGGAADARRVAPGSGVAATIDRLRAHVRRRIEATYAPEAAPLGRALVLGETDLSADDRRAFRDSGLSHLLAVSGAHLAIAVLGLESALRAALARVELVAARVDPSRLTALLALGAAWFYADFAGGSGSAVRAAWMLTGVLAARALGRKPSGPRAFAWSLVLGSLADPLVATDVSFVLSVAATAGLFVLSPAIAALLARRGRKPGRIAQAAAAALGATAACAPVIATLSGSLPLLGVAANLVAGPVGESAALPASLAHAVLGWFPVAERATAVVASGALLVVRAVARFSASTGAVVYVPPPTPLQLAAIAVTAAAALATTSRSRRVAHGLLGAGALAVLEIGAMCAGAPRGALRVSVLDVGQGDAILVDLPDGSCLLVDGGGLVGSPVDTGSRVVRPVLAWRRRRRIDVAVLSHPHPDHFGGLASVLAEVDVGEVWDTGEGRAHGAGPVYASLIESLSRRGIPVRGPEELCGEARRFGDARVRVLAPCPAFDPDAGANDNSFVLHVALGERAALLVGDAEAREEAALVARHGASLRADLLKVGHHGSRTSSGPALLDAVRPAVGAVSCGVRNRFGHPHAEIIGRFEALGIPLLRTDRGGEIVWETDGNRMRVRRPGS